MSDIALKLPVTIGDETRDVDFVGHVNSEFAYSRFPVALARRGHVEFMAHVVARRRDGSEDFVPSGHVFQNGYRAPLIGWTRIQFRQEAVA